MFHGRPPCVDDREPCRRACLPVRSGDVLDVVGDERVLGKRAGSDAAKATYPGAFGVVGSREIAARLTEDAVAAIRPLGVRGTLLQELARSLLAREH